MDGMKPHIIILTEGHSEPNTAKTAAGILRYRGGEVAALLDSTAPRATAGELLGVGDDVPVIHSLNEAPDADTLLIGVATTGGQLPPSMRAHIREAIQRGWEIISGLHAFLSDDEEFAGLARQSSATLTDLRRNTERDVARREGLRHDCLRLHTVGPDCGIGKMVAALELARGLTAEGIAAKFIATGQTGIMIEGDGCPVDAVVADFISGAVEKQILSQQHHDVLIVEGQGSLIHPCYSGVTLGLLHGCLPHALVLCHPLGRTHVKGLEHIPLPSLDETAELYRALANAAHPCHFLGVAINSRGADEAAFAAEKNRVETLLGLPACDVVREGPGILVTAARRLLAEREGT